MVDEPAKPSPRQPAGAPTGLPRPPGRAVGPGGTPLGPRPVNLPGGKPRLSYLICASPRTGSYLLCEGLKETGVAGNPTEYFSDGYQAYWTRRWKTVGYEAYLRRACEVGTSRNGVFAVKTHGRQLSYFLRQTDLRARVPLGEQPGVVERYFPGARYVWLRRADKRKQGLSYAKSLQTKVWWHADEAPAPFDAPTPEALRFDFGLIERAMAQMEEDDAIWHRFFAANGISPLILDYEDMVADREGAVRAVLDHVGIPVPPTFALPPSQFTKMSDGRSAQWLDRFSRLTVARREGTLAAFRDIHLGASVFMTASESAGTVLPRTPDSVTVAVHPASESMKADYALHLVPPGTPAHGRALTVNSDADVLFTNSRSATPHPFAVRFLLERTPPPLLDSLTTIRAPKQPFHPAWAGLALAAHLGGTRIGAAGLPRRRGSDGKGGVTPGHVKQFRGLHRRLLSRGVKVWDIEPGTGLGIFPQLDAATFAGLPSAAPHDGERRLRVVVYSATGHDTCAELSFAVLALTADYARSVCGEPSLAEGVPPHRTDLDIRHHPEALTHELRFADAVILDGGDAAGLDDSLLAGKVVVTLQRPDGPPALRTFLDQGQPGIRLEGPGAARPDPGEWTSAPTPAVPTVDPTVEVPSAEQASDFPAQWRTLWRPLLLDDPLPPAPEPEPAAVGHTTAASESE